MPRLIAVLPIYNEASGDLKILLEKVYRATDLVVLVDDASTDETPGILREFLRARRGAYLVSLPANRGMAGALEAGFRFVLYLREKKKIENEDVVVTMDADGQHRPEDLRKGLKYLVENRYDVVLGRRDFSVYPKYKKLGNRFLTFVNRFLSGFPYQDVECGFRWLKVKVLQFILPYYAGVKYSCAQEIALLTARCGFRVDNNFKIHVPHYRQGTTWKDGFVVLWQAWKTYRRWIQKKPLFKPGETSLWRKCERASKKLWESGKTRRTARA